MTILDERSISGYKTRVFEIPSWFPRSRGVGEGMRTKTQTPGTETRTVLGKPGQ